MMKDTENLIWVEHRDRELGYARLLANRLAHNGLGSTTILSLPFHLPLGALLAPRRVFVPFLRTFQDEALAGLRQPPQQVLNMNYEQLLGYFNREVKRPNLPGALQLYWYEAFSEILDDWNIPGATRVRLPSPESQLVTRRAREQGWHRTRDGRLHERIVFIPENFAWAFADATLMRKKAKAGFRWEQIERLRDYSRKSLQAFAPELLACCNAYSDIAFVLRPHPSVSIETYEEELQRYGKLPVNLVISKSGSAWDWLGGSDAVISGWSTVTYSAHQIGIPSGLHHPFPLISELDVPWVAAMPRFKYFRDAVDRLLSYPPQPNSNSSGCVDFDALFIRLRQDRPTIDWPHRNGRKRLLARALLASILRHLGLVWRPARARVLNVYHADYFAPIRVAASTTIC
jgi:hypothetical protein